MRATTVILKDAAGAISGDASGSLTFGPQSLNQIFGYSIQAVYTGSPAGVLTLQASNDGTNFCDIPGTAFTVSAAGSFLWNVTGSNYLYVQMTWVPTSGSGTLSAFAYIRGF